MIYKKEKNHNDMYHFTLPARIAIIKKKNKRPVSARMQRKGEGDPHALLVGCKMLLWETV